MDEKKKNGSRSHTSMEAVLTFELSLHGAEHHTHSTTQKETSDKNCCAVFNMSDRIKQSWRVLPHQQPQAILVAHSWGEGNFTRTDKNKRKQKKSHYQLSYMLSSINRGLDKVLVGTEQSGERLSKTFQELRAMCNNNVTGDLIPKKQKVTRNGSCNWLQREYKGIIQIAQHVQSFCFQQRQKNLQCWSILSSFTLCLSTQLGVILALQKGQPTPCSIHVTQHTGLRLNIWSSIQELDHGVRLVHPTCYRQTVTISLIRCVMKCHRLGVCCVFTDWDIRAIFPSWLKAHELLQQS